MGLVINTNVGALTASRNLTNNTNNLNTSMERLSTGFRINRAADDAAGLTISETLKAQHRGADVAKANAQDGINMLQTAEGDLAVIQENLHRIRDLTVQAANDTNTSADRNAIVSEVDARVKEINRLAGGSKFNNINLLDGSSSSIKLQIGFSSDTSVSQMDIKTPFKDATASGLGISTAVSTALAKATAAADFLDEVDSAIKTVSTRRSEIGSWQNRLGSTIQSLSITSENIQASESRIRDVDVAKEAASMSKSQILQQASLSLLSQANQAPGLALSLV